MTKLFGNNDLRLMLVWSLLLCALTLVSTGETFAQTATDSDVRPLVVGQTTMRELKGGEAHSYSLNLQAGQFLNVVVEQKGVDVVVALFDSSNKKLAENDSPNGLQGPEPLSFIVEMTGNYRLEVLSPQRNAPVGKYEAKIVELRTATEIDKDKIAVQKLYVEATNLRSKRTADSIRSALAKYDEALILYRKLEDKTGEANALNSIGRTYYFTGDNNKAITYFEKALEIRKAINDKENEVQTLGNMGLSYGLLGENTKALDFLNQSLFLAREIKDENNEATALNNIGQIYKILGENAKAIDYYNQSSLIHKKVGSIDGEAAALNNIGTVYFELGENEKAIYYFNLSLPLYRIIRDKQDEATTLINIGNVYFSLGDNLKALETFNQASTIFKQSGNKQGESVTLLDIGRIYDKLNENEKALDYYNQALLLAKRIGNRFGEATTLNNIGAFYKKTGDKEKAFDNYNQALTIRKQIGDKRGEAISLSNFMYLCQQFDNPRFAIFYGKQSVNKFQDLRQNIKTLDRETQKTFLGTISQVYRKLADILISEGRIVEAEQVLALLKQEEVFDYLRRDSAEADKLSQRADLTKDEADALKRYNEYADKITTLGAEFGKLQTLKNKGVVLTGEQQTRFDELSKQLDDANKVFAVFLRELADEFAKRANAKTDVQANLALQSDLKSFGDDVVFLYTLVGEDRYRVIVSTSNAQTDGKTEIKGVDLDKKIAAFRDAVQDSRSDPKPLGKELYDILIKPIEKQLDGAKAKTLLWSLDGNLRLLPLAALWDGKQYFGQKYQNVTVTLANRTKLKDIVAQNWRVLGLGVSQAETVTEPNGTRKIDFPALPSVKSELSSIVQSDKSPKGVMPGQILIDNDFSEKNLETQLPLNYKVVHIASHFSLNAGDATKSFLLLGNNVALTVDEMRNNPKIGFGDVELLTLSACQTAVAEKDGTGKEIEGFGYVAQQKGAKAILATLWSVSDDSTQLLMSEFYRLRKANPNFTKAEAMQKTQNVMIKGKLKGAGNKQLSHPFYWSPFVLIGNWR